MIELKQRLLESLRSKVCVVEFTKKDGSKRVMKCTLHRPAIPAEHTPKEDTEVLYDDQGQPFGFHSVSKPPQPEHTIRVYDIEKAAWRSFITESVLTLDGVPCKK